MSDSRTDRSRSQSSILRTLVALPFSLVPTPMSSCISPFASHASTILRVPLLENVALASTTDPRPAREAQRQSRWTGWRSRGGRRRGGPVEAIFVEIGRRDAYPGHTADVSDLDASEVEEGAESALVPGRGDRGWRSSGSLCRGRELQVYEAWIKVQVKPNGLRYVLASF